MKSNANGIQIIGSKVYYKMQHVANLSDFNVGQSMDEFKLKLISLNEDKYCPKCESIMIRRVAKSGFNTGKEFWGCSRYPKCRYILRTEEDR